MTADALVQSGNHLGVHVCRFSRIAHEMAQFCQGKFPMIVAGLVGEKPYAIYTTEGRTRLSHLPSSVRMASGCGFGGRTRWAGFSRT